MIYICEIPSKVLAQARVRILPNMYCSCANILLQNIARQKSNLDHLLHVRISSPHHTTHSLLSLQSHATRPSAGHRRPPISAIPIVPKPPPSDGLQQPSFRRLSKLFRFSRTNTVPVRHIQPRDPLDVCLDSCISVLRHLTLRWHHRSLLHYLYHPLSQLSPQLDLIRSVFNSYTKPGLHDRMCIQFEIGFPPPPSSGVVQSLRQHLSFLVPRHTHGPPVVDVAPGRKFTVTLIFLFLSVFR
jgi:hypothetical protein